MKSEQWLAERTFHHSNFWDIKWLVRGEGTARPDDLPLPAGAQ